MRETLTVRRRLVRPEWLLATGFVLTLVVLGAAMAHHDDVCDSARHAVSFLPVASQNLLLTLVLMTGVFTMGLSTLLIGAVILGITGASVGAIVGSFGWQGVLLVAPHGVFELAAWVVGASVGLLPLTRRLPSSTPLPSTGLQRQILLRVALAVALVLLAALVEMIWTNFYGPRAEC
jgi:uncharacterized membrane protein SpoIIM required for sporulation